uniref:Uncharacterized protein n=1 Tax=Arundo donax TaxID=35708 RepID=A0A0A9A2H8_ARUDO
MGPHTPRGHLEVPVGTEPLPHLVGGRKPR